jgi:hypothetical protein
LVSACPSRKRERRTDNPSLTLPARTNNQWGSGCEDIPSAGGGGKVGPEQHGQSALTGAAHSQQLSCGRQCRRQHQRWQKQPEFRTRTRPAINAHT